MLDCVNLRNPLVEKCQVRSVQDSNTFRKQLGVKDAKTCDLRVRTCPAFELAGFLESSVKRVCLVRIQRWDLMTAQMCFGTGDKDLLWDIEH